MLIFDHAYANIFQSTFNFYESALTCKKTGFLTFYFRETVNFKTLQSDWPRAFWPISQEQASAYEACDRTRIPLHTPKTLETC